MSHVIPQFPEFIKLDIAHKDVLTEIVRDFPVYSDFNFVSLFTWDVDGMAALSFLNENLVIRFSDYIDGSQFYTFIGRNHVDETAKTLLEYAKQAGGKTELLLVPHSVASKTSSEEFEIIEDTDNHDYVLSVNDLVEFRTNKYRGKKNLYNRFQKHYSEQAATKELDLNDQKVCDDILRVVADWRNYRGKSLSEIANELAAIKRGISHKDNLGIRAFGTYIDSELVAFNIFEIAHSKMAIIHFDKANYEYMGVAEQLKHNFAKHLARMDIETINYEQDLGIEGLRKHKQSLHPVDYLKKYTIRSRIT